MLVTICVIVASGVAFGAGLTHATGANPADVQAIKAAITKVRHVEPPSIDWYIAVEGRYAVAFDGCGPGACDENQLVRSGGTWIVSCYTTGGKGLFGTCIMPRRTEQALVRSALSLYHGP
jgi:hypothetical protein